MAYGMKGFVGIGFQSSYGTAETGSYHWIPIINESLVEAKPSLYSESIRGIYEQGDSYEGPNEISGEIVMSVHPLLFGKLLKAWCGYSSGTLVVSHYSHEFKPRATDFDAMAAVPPMTIQVYRDAGSAHQYYDCLCNELTLEIAHGSFLKTTMGVIGGKFTTAVKGQPTYLPGSEFVWDQSSISFASGAIDELSSFSITLNNNLEGKGTVDGTKTFNRIKRAGFRTIEVAGTLLFVDQVEHDLFRARTGQRMIVDVVGQLVSSGYSAELKIDMPQVKYKEFPVNIGGPGTIEVGFTGDAEYHAGSATMVEFTLVNTLAAY